MGSLKTQCFEILRVLLFTWAQHTHTAATTSAPNWFVDPGAHTALVWGSSRRPTPVHLSIGDPSTRGRTRQVTPLVPHTQLADPRNNSQRKTWCGSPRHSSVSTCPHQPSGRVSTLVLLLRPPLAGITCMTLLTVCTTALNPAACHTAAARCDSTVAHLGTQGWCFTQWLQHIDADDWSPLWRLPVRPAGKLSHF